MITAVSISRVMTVLNHTLAACFHRCGRCGMAVWLGPDGTVTDLCCPRCRHPLT